MNEERIDTKSIWIPTHIFTSHNENDDDDDDDDCVLCKFFIKHQIVYQHHATLCKEIHLLLPSLDIVVIVNTFEG
jgi:hypothetical protein